MPRGMHPNSRANLKKGRRFNEETARKASEKSVETRKNYANMQSCFRDMIDDQTRSKLYAMLLNRALAGNLRAFEILRDTLGEKPTEHVEAELYEDDGFIEALMSAGKDLVADDPPE